MSHKTAQDPRAQYAGEERGVDADDIDAATVGPDALDAVTSNTSSSPRHVRFPPGHFNDNSSGSSSAIQSLTSASTLSTLESKLDLSPTEVSARRGLLRDSFFDSWKDDATSPELESPEEMQKNDPLGAQIWKLYHRTRGQLPNSERLENLTWRMMSMNLRRKELERQGYSGRCWPRTHKDWHADILASGSLPAALTRTHPAVLHSCERRRIKRTGATMIT